MKKTILLLLVCLIAIISVVGCSNSGNSKKQGGDEIVYYNSQFPYKEGTGNKEAIEEVQQYILEQTGIKVTAVIPQKGAEEQKLNTMLAANEKIDIFIGELSKYRSINAIMPLNDLIDKYGQDVVKAWPESAWDSLKDKDGKIWALPRAISSTPYPAMIRKDWLAKVGVNKLPSTVEEFENALQLFKEKDPAGKSSTVPLMCNLDGLRYSLLGAYTDNGVGNWLDEADNKVKPVVLHPGYLEWLKTLNRWYQNGYIYKEAFMAKPEQFTDLAVSNRVAASMSWYSQIFSSYAKIQNNAPDVDYQILTLTGSKGKTESLFPAPVQGYMITNNSKNSVEAMKFLNWGFSSYDNYLTTRYGIKDKHWSYIQKDENTVIVDIVANTGYDGEFATQGYSSSPKQPVLSSKDPTKKAMYDYIQKHYYDYERVKIPFDGKVNYDLLRMDEKGFSRNDINTMIEEATVKFIIGTRPLSEFDKFIDSLNAKGMNKYVDELTAQYNETK